MMYTRCIKTILEGISGLLEDDALEYAELGHDERESIWVFAEGCLLVYTNEEVDFIIHWDEEFERRMAEDLSLPEGSVEVGDYWRGRYSEQFDIITILSPSRLYTGTVHAIPRAVRKASSHKWLGAEMRYYYNDYRDWVWVPE